jgi:hypothetical protein
MSTKIDLASLELVKADSDWIFQASPEPVFVVRPFRDVLNKMMVNDTIGFLRLGVSHIDAYKKLWGEPAFIYDGKYPWKTWIFKLAEGEHLVLYSDKDGGTSFEYAGPITASQEAFEKGMAILMTIKDVVHAPKEPDVEFGM